MSLNPFSLGLNKPVPQFKLFNASSVPLLFCVSKRWKTILKSFVNVVLKLSPTSSEVLRKLLGQYLTNPKMGTEHFWSRTSLPLTLKLRLFEILVSQNSFHVGKIVFMWASGMESSGASTAIKLCTTGLHRLHPYDVVYNNTISNGLFLNIFQAKILNQKRIRKYLMVK